MRWGQLQSAEIWLLLLSLLSAFICSRESYTEEWFLKLPPYTCHQSPPSCPWSDTPAAPFPAVPVPPAAHCLLPSSTVSPAFNCYRGEL